MPRVYNLQDCKSNMQGIKKIMALLWRTESNLECTRECSGDLKQHLKIVLRISQTLTAKFTFEWKSQSLAVSYSLELKSLIRYDLLWAMGRISLPKKQRKFIGLQLVPGVIIASEPYEWISHLRKLIRRSHNEWPDFLFSDSISLPHLIGLGWHISAGWKSTSLLLWQSELFWLLTAAEKLICESGNTKQRKSAI